MRNVCLVVVLFGCSILPPLTCGCAGALPVIAAAAPVAARALDWIAQVDRHVTPQLERVDAATAQVVKDAIPSARAAAIAVRDCGRAVEGGAKLDCAAALANLETELDSLFKAGRPLGVQPVGQPGLLGAAPGFGILGVPSACDIVHGDDAVRCKAEAAGPAPSEGATLDAETHCMVPANALSECPADCMGCLVTWPRREYVRPAADGFACGTLGVTTGELAATYEALSP